MRKLVFFPLDATKVLLEKGSTMEEIEKNYNPNGYFDRVYVISTKDKVDDYGTLVFIKADIDEIIDIVRQINPIAIRANAGYECSDIAMVCRLMGIPIMISVHDSLYENISQSIVYADKVAYISEIVRDSIIKCTGIPDNKLLYLPRYVDMNIFKRKNDRDIFEKLNNRYGIGKHIIHVGRRTEQKNLKNTIRALKYLPDEYSLISIGKGDTGEYKSIANDEGVSSRLFFEEGLSHEELSFFYSWCDCMCTPSRWEGFGLVFIEACACGCMVVTSNTAPMNEYLVDNESAYLVNDIENPKEIADKIIEACQNTEKNKQIGENAFKVGLRFDEKYAFKKEVENYKKLIAEGVDFKTNERLLAELQKLDLPVVIYGAGKNGISFLKYMRLVKKEPLFFVDNSKDKQETAIDNVFVYSPSELKHIDNKVLVVVTPYDKKEILKELKADGLMFMEMGLYKTLMNIKIKEVK